MGKHNLNNPGFPHAVRPLEQQVYYQPNDRVPTRKETFSRVRQQALQSVEEVNKAITKYSALMEKAIWDLVFESDTLLRQLKDTELKLRNDIEAALEEVERTLGEDRPRFTSFYGPVLRDMVETSRTAPLFSYSLHVSPLSCPVTLQYQVASPHELLQAERLALAFGNKALLYDIQSGQISRSTFSVDFGGGGSFIELDKNTLLCLGAVPASAAVYLLDLVSFRLSPQSSLCTPRCSPGVAKVTTCVYVFGSAGASDVNSRTCEKMEVADMRWQELSSRMACSRGGFTPCTFRFLLYLVSCCRYVETFDPASELFSTLSIYLPPQLQLDSSSVAFIVNEELCLLTGKKQMARWKINSEREFRLSDIGIAVWSNQQPVVVGALVLIACAGGVVHFNMVNYSFKYVN